MQSLNVPPENESKGLLFGVISALLFSVMAIASQQLPSEISSSQISTFRGLFTTIALMPFAWAHLPKLLNIKVSRSVWIRSISGGIAVICYFYNLEYTSAADAKALANTNPFYVAIFAWFLYREKLTRFEFVGLVILLTGAWMLALDMKQLDGAFQWIVGNVGSFFTAIAFLSLKRASGKFPTHVIVFSFGVAVTIVSALTPGNWALPTLTQWPWLILVGATGLGGQIFLTYSYMNLKNTVASALTLLQSLMLIIYDLTWTGRLHQGIGLWGNVLIMIGMMLMILWKKKPLPLPIAALEK
ncbi:MAG: DMT family transporter [Bacteriovoracaceae bacterium]|nr:DMT family transporter [Bacteriovoracaceae bacterium]